MVNVVLCVLQAIMDKCATISVPMQRMVQTVAVNVDNVVMTQTVTRSVACVRLGATQGGRDLDVNKVVLLGTMGMLAYIDVDSALQVQHVTSPTAHVTRDVRSATLVYAVLMKLERKPN